MNIIRRIDETLKQIEDMLRPPTHEILVALHEQRRGKMREGGRKSWTVEQIEALPAWQELCYGAPHMSDRDFVSSAADIIRRVERGET